MARHERTNVRGQMTEILNLSSRKFSSSRNSLLFQSTAEKLFKAFGLRIFKNLLRRTIFFNEPFV